MQLTEALERAALLFKDLQQTRVGMLDALHAKGSAVLEAYKDDPGEANYVELCSHLEEEVAAYAELVDAVGELEALCMATPVCAPATQTATGHIEMGLPDYLDFSHAYVDAYGKELEMKEEIVRAARQSNAYQLTALLSAWQLRPSITDGNASRFPLRHRLKLAQQQAQQ